MDNGIWIFFLVIYLIALNVLIGSYIGEQRGRGLFGGFLSFLLGPLAWIIVLNMKDARAKCKYCDGPITQGVMKCRHCGSELEWVANK